MVLLPWNSLLHPAPVYTSRKTAPTHKAWKSFQKTRWKEFESQKNREFCVRLCPLGMSDAIPRESYQPDCPNVSWTRVIAKDMLTWTGGAPWNLKAALRIQATKEYTANSLPLRIAHLLVIQYKGSSQKNTYKWHYTDWASYIYIFRNIYVM